MKDDVRNKAAGELQQRFMQLQEIFARLQKDLAAKEQEATRGILAKLSAVVGKIAEREKFAMVLERSSAVVWGQPSLDITNEVIRLYNQQGGASNKK
jgi:Skp family chaperone for outer membrane proteins